MTAKEYLKQMKDIDNTINILSLEILQAEGMGMKTTSSMQEVPVHSGVCRDKVGDSASAAQNLMDEMNCYIKRLMQMKREAVRILRKVMPVKYQNLLLLYYFQNLTLEETAVRIGKSYQTICAWHGAALQKFQQIMDEEGNFSEETNMDISKSRSNAYKEFMSPVGIHNDDFKTGLK